MYNRNIDIGIFNNFRPIPDLYVLQPGVNKMSLQKLLNDIINKEGGFVDNPNDKGGPTKYGITIAALNKYTRGHNGKQDIQAITREVAKKIYADNYYDKPGIYLLPGAIQPIIFDAAVNHGPQAAIQMLQAQLLADGYPGGKIDGIIGYMTVRAAEKASSELGKTFINNLVSRRIAKYRKIIEHDPTQAVFEKGWITRAESFSIA